MKGVFVTIAICCIPFVTPYKKVNSNWGGIGALKGNETSCKTNGELVSYPGDCRKFFECANNVLVPKICPESLLWNDNIKTCDYSQNVNCQGSTWAPIITTTSKRPSTTKNPDSSCTENNELMPFPGDCRKFYECSGNVLIPNICPPGLLWNDNNKTCDYPQNVNCDGSTWAPVATEPSMSKFDLDPSCKHEGDLLPDPDNCKQFYKCSNGTKIPQDCPLSLVWNDKIKQCDWSSNVPQCQ